MLNLSDNFRINSHREIAVVTVRGFDLSGDTEYWVLRLGKRWTGGRVVRRTFSSAGEARKAWEKEALKRESLGTGSYELSPSQLGEAIACFRQLEGTVLSLSHAVKLSLKNFRPKTASIPFSDAVRSFLSAQKDRDAAEKTIIGYQSFLHLLAEELPAKINLHEITDKEIRKHLAKYEKPASRNATIRHLRAFFRWTCKRGWRDADPTEHIDKTREIDEAVSILNVTTSTKTPRVVCRRFRVPTLARLHCYRSFRRAPH